jgi:hypothetical protein
MFICDVSLAQFVFLVQNVHELFCGEFDILFFKNLKQLFFRNVAQTMLNQVVNYV